MDFKEFQRTCKFILYTVLISYTSVWIFMATPLKNLDSSIKLIFIVFSPLIMAFLYGFFHELFKELERRNLV